MVQDALVAPRGQMACSLTQSMVKAALSKPELGLGLAAVVGEDRAEQRDAVDALGPLDVGGSEVGGVHDVLGRSQATGREVVVDLLGQLPILDGSNGGGHVHHQVRQVLITRLGEMNPVSAPLDITFDAVVRVRVIRGVELQGGRLAGQCPPASAAAPRDPSSTGGSRPAAGSPPAAASADGVGRRPPRPR